MFVKTSWVYVSCLLTLPVIAQSLCDSLYQCLTGIIGHRSKTSCLCRELVSLGFSFVSSSSAVIFLLNDEPPLQVSLHGLGMILITLNLPFESLSTGYAWFSLHWNFLFRKKGYDKFMLLLAERKNLNCLACSSYCIQLTVFVVNNYLNVIVSESHITWIS